MTLRVKLESANLRLNSLVKISLNRIRFMEPRLSPSSSRLRFIQLWLNTSMRLSPYELKMKLLRANRYALTSLLSRLAALLQRDENLYRLRKEILTQPVLLREAARQLWPNDPQAEDGLQALLEIVATAKQDETHDDLLPTRLHYFVRAQDGLHVCLSRQCPARRDGKPAFFVSRKNENTPEGLCPDCNQVDRRSNLVEVVTCRKCGYLYGALQDLGPRRAQNLENWK